MKIDKTVTIPQYTEVEVEIDTDEVLEDMDMDSIVDYAVENYSNKQVLRYMQHNHDFSEDDIEEAVGRKFVSDEPIEVTWDDVMKYIKGTRPEMKLAVIKVILGDDNDNISL